MKMAPLMGLVVKLPDEGLILENGFKNNNKIGSWEPKSIVNERIKGTRQFLNLLYLQRSCG